jgi:hypothetical protein
MVTWLLVRIVVDGLGSRSTIPVFGVGLEHVRVYPGGPSPGKEENPGSAGSLLRDHALVRLRRPVPGLKARDIIPRG